MRYLLDTNIISNAIKPVPSPAWLGAQADADLFIAALTLGEIWRGVLQKPAGAGRARLEAWFAGPGGRGRCLQGGYWRSMRRWSGGG